MAKLYVGNTLLLEVTGLKDSAGDAVTGATVEATVKASDGTEVSGVTWPITLSDDGGGDYSGVIPAAASLVADKQYTVEITATSGSDVAKWTEPVRAFSRTFS